MIYIPQVEPVLNLEVINRIQSRTAITNPKAVVQSLGELALMKPYEQSFALFLDGGLHPIATICCGQGTPCRTLIDLQTIVSSALLLCSKAVIIVHTHPAGCQTEQPSTADIKTTEDLLEKFRWFGITLVDSFILLHCADDQDGVSYISILDWIKAHENNTKNNEPTEEVPEVAMI